MTADIDHSKTNRALSSKSYSLEEGIVLLGKALKKADAIHHRQREILDEIMVKTGDQVGAPLVLSCFLGYKEVVQLLLKNDLVDIEQTATVQLQENCANKAAEGATALWSACYAGHLEIIKLLVEQGASVNHATKTLSTPLRTACFRGRLDIVQCLVEHGADTNARNNEGNTCLMAAAYNRHDNIVRYLVIHGAALDMKDRNGYTALHHAAERGHVSTVKLLTKIGAIEVQNNDGLSPSKLACVNCRPEVVKWFISGRDRRRREVIETLELLGATYATHPAKQDVNKAYELITAAMRERFVDPEDVIHKFARPPIKAYGYRIECQTLEELSAIKGQSRLIQQEGLIMRERLLRSDNRLVPSHVRHMAASMADGGLYEESLELWKHAAKLEQRNGFTVLEHFSKVAHLLFLMAESKHPLSFNQVEDVFTNILAATGELLNKVRTRRPSTQTRQLCGMSNLASLELLCIALQLELGHKEEQSLQRLVNKFLNLDPPTLAGGTLLHLAVSGKLPEVSGKLPAFGEPLAQVRFILEARADVKYPDNLGNTPLHVAAAVQHTDGQEHCPQTAIVRALLEAGADISALNKDGLTPAEMTSCGEVKTLLSHQL